MPCRGASTKPPRPPGAGWSSQGASCWWLAFQVEGYQTGAARGSSYDDWLKALRRPYQCLNEGIIRPWREARDPGAGVPLRGFQNWGRGRPCPHSPGFSKSGGFHLALFFFLSKFKWGWLPRDSPRGVATYSTFLFIGAYRPPPEKQIIQIWPLKR